MIRNLRLCLLATMVLTLPMSLSLTAQELSQNKLLKDSRVLEVKVSPERQTPSLIKFNNAQAPTISELMPMLNDAFSLKNSPYSLVIKGKPYSNNDVATIKLQQYFKGIKVEHGLYSALLKNDHVRSLTGEFYDLDANLSNTPSLSESDALQKALQYVGATKYVWDYIDELSSKTVNIEILQGLAKARTDYYPKGELVYVDNYSTQNLDLSLAYKFNVYAADPISRAYIYVDAQSGKILLNDPIIKHVADKKTSENRPLVQGSGDTRYAGNRSFDTTFDVVNNNYILSGTAINGIENETRSLEGLGGIPLNLPALYAASVPITDNDNSWTAAEHRPDDFSLPYPLHNEYNNDDIALDAHWGAEIVLKYWFEKHGRSSYDNLGTKVFNFVHYGDAYDNAFWNGEAMTYGDGSAQQGLGGGFLPLTSMDVCGHEIGHGICEFTSGLVYQRESGAMNEGFSDIWAAAVENYVLTEIDNSLPYQIFGIGEQIDNRDEGVGPGQADTEALRWMDDPQAAGDPDSYGGNNWQEPECGEPTLANDYCGVHTNSGVLNKWYYLLVSGSGQALSPGAGKAAVEDEISDGGRTYSITGLGFAVADQIAFTAETMLTPNSTFADMRNASIIAAETLYGINEVEQVTNAWYAVDIGDEFDPGDPNRITFNSSNTMFTNENTPTSDCDAQKVVSLGITAVELPSPQTITIDASASTATLGVDFDLSDTSFTFPAGSSNATLEVIIYNDAIVEDVELISLSFTYNAIPSTQTLEIADNDVLPVIGDEAVELLPTETFDVSSIPAGWDVIMVNEFSASTWEFNGVGQAAGKAYITNGTDTPTYDINADTNVILKSPMLNGLGHKNIEVQFDWEAGGEQDLTSGDLFDYGEFLYSKDGTNFTSVETFVGTNGGNTVASGTFNMAIPALDNSQFMLGWRWFNDALVGSAFSFTIDNVSVMGTPSYIEMQLDASTENRINTNNGVYFLSSQNQDIMALIENASDDLGCVEMKVVSAGSSSTVDMPAIGAVRASKVIEITADGPNAANATYNITLYFANTELAEFTDPSILRILKVKSSNIDDASDVLQNYVVAGTMEEDNTQFGYKTYKAQFTGFSTFSVAEGGNILSTENFVTNNSVLYPSVIRTGENINISGNLPITSAKIFDVRGALVQTEKFQGTNTVTFATTALKSGLYFVILNEDKTKVFKFIVQ